MQERPTELAQLIDQLAARGRTTGGDHTAVVSADA
jgi:hypothetical protein